GDGPTVVELCQTPDIKITKTASYDDGGDCSDAGEEILYTFTVTNTGNVTLTSVTVSESSFSGTGTISPAYVSSTMGSGEGTLNPGESATYTASYAIAQSDIDAGFVSNQAEASGSGAQQTVTDLSDATIEGDSPTVVELCQNPEIDIQKVAGVASVDTAGDEIPYTLTVTNTGNLTLSGVTVTDPLTGLNQNIGSMTPGQVVVIPTSYIVTQADIDNGLIENVASASGFGGETQVSDQDDAVVEAIQTPSIDIEKVANVGSVDAVGDEIEYTLTVTNTGNMTLSDVTVTDPLTGLDQTIGSMTPGQVVVIPTSYIVTQADIDNGLIENVASTAGFGGETQVTDQDEAVVEAIQTPSIDIEKVTAVTSVDAVGDEIEYTLTVTNTGNMTLSDVTVTDPLTGLDQNIGSMTPGEVVEITTTYAVTQADLDNGLIENVATVTGMGGDTQVTDQDEAVVEAERLPNISLTKEVDLESVSREGIVLNYTLVVTNTGNVTLSSGDLTDPKTGMTVPGITLAPGESKTFTTTYTVTLEDLLSGEPILNIANVQAIDPQSQKTVRAEAQATVVVNLEPGISIEKTSDVSEVTNTGDVITYTLVVTNTGTAPLVNVVVSDPLTGFEETIALLLPGGTREYTTTYTVTEEDLAEGGELVNTATVTGTAPGGSTVEDDDSAVVGLAPEIIANDDDFGTHFVSFGGRLGNILENDLLDGKRPDPADVDFEFVELDGVIGLLIDEDGEMNLIPGVNPEGEYTLRYILREAGNPDNNDDALVVFRLVNDNVNLNITKEAMSEEVFEGDEFEYEITASNIGGFDARNVVITDDLPNGVTYISNRVESNSANVDVETSVDGSRIQWTIGLFPADATITFRIRVKAGAAGSVTNVVIVGADEEDTDETDNQDTDVTVIKPFHIPNVITPNNDGTNDTFEVQGLDKFVSNSITIINRYGDHVLEEENYQNDWDAPGQVAGTYFYILVTIDSQGNEHVFKGWIQVIKED
ncbi:DUF7507 domain-containing protein, partial [Algoriphagus zhangzhouensis]